jgi:hypothetical protein
MNKQNGNPAGEIVAGIAGGAFVLVAVVVGLNWWAITSIEGEATPALAGAFMMFEIIMVVYILFSLFGITTEMIRGRMERARFQDNTVENQAVMQNAILAGRARKENAAADLNDVKALAVQNTQLQREIKELRGAAQPASSANWLFDDGGYTTIEGEYSEQ